MVLPQRPTNTSRLLQNSHGGSNQRPSRAHRTHTGISADADSSGSGNHFSSQYQISGAASSGMRTNSFARSAMRLKQKTSRNGIPNRGGSLDGCSQTHSEGEEQQTAVATPGIISRAGRTGGAAVWSRMLNMQSVEEGIQEGNVSSEDD